MTGMRFDDFAKAYRAAHSNELDAPALLHRIQGTLSRRDDRRWRRRWMTWLCSMGLTTALGASLAYATPLAQSLLQWINEEPAAASGTAASATAASNTGPNVEVAVAAPFLEPRTTATEVTTPAALPSRPLTPGSASSPTFEPRPASSRERTSTGSARSRKSNGVVSNSHISNGIDEASSLYDTAQRLQFAERNYAAALAAWDRYLEATTDTPLRGDAAYNHAVCLLHLKRYQQARIELTRLSGPTSAPAYRSRAATLLQSLAARAH